MEAATSMMEAERGNLRSELQFLKECQVRYFFLSVTAAGAVTGFGEKMSEFKAGPSIYLAPLLIVLPCWWIFFDKATTIARIVAYLRLLEDGILSSVAGSPSNHRYLGWENSLREYRAAEAGEPKRTKWSNYLLGVWYGFRYSVTFATTHKYWSINWWTFVGLALACLGLSYRDTSPRGLAGWYPSVALCALSAFHNLSVVGRLTKGSYSYEACYKRWEQVLRAGK